MARCGWCLCHDCESCAGARVRCTCGHLVRTGFWVSEHTGRHCWGCPVCGWRRGGADPDEQARIMFEHHCVGRDGMAHEKSNYEHVWDTLDGITDQIYATPNGSAEQEALKIRARAIAEVLGIFYTLHPSTIGQEAGWRREQRMRGVAPEYRSDAQLRGAWNDNLHLVGR